MRFDDLAARRLGAILGQRLHLSEGNRRCDRGVFTYDQSLVGANNEFQIWVTEGAGHIFPNGTNHPLVMADEQWEFFKKYRR